jgi:fumarate hydratase class I
MAPQFTYQDLLPIGEDKTEYRLLTKEGISSFSADGKQFLKVSPEVI